MNDYYWHDLKEDPTDLPTYGHGEDVLVAYKDPDAPLLEGEFCYWIQTIESIRKYGFTEEDHAWKYIEPFNR